ncbi:MAG: UDP-glucose 4-epimerase GalE [Cyanobacteriota bacterium]|jgi:UDP-glucose 4-epimerase
MTILVTGGAGYIGSHAVRALQRGGLDVVVLDNLVYGHRPIVEEALQVPLVEGQVGDRDLLDQLLQGTHPALARVPGVPGEPIQAVLHFAAYAYVGESVVDPAKYYRNNLGDTLTLLEALVAEGRRRGAPVPIVFSSTCATYGVPDEVPILETTPQHPINPYGHSKRMVERLLMDFGAAYGLPSVIFRYFNAAGADPAADLGENHTPETHLIPLVLDAITGRIPFLQIFGDDYPTADGTCVRDYIHVADLAEAHLLGLRWVASEARRLGEIGPGSPTVPAVFNLGNGKGYSVRQVIQSAEAVTGRTVPARVAPRRPGDPPVLLAAADKAQRELGWRPRYPELEVILRHAWAWHQRLHGEGECAA